MGPCRHFRDWSPASVPQHWGPILKNGLRRVMFPSTSAQVSVQYARNRCKLRMEISTSLEGIRAVNFPKAGNPMSCWRGLEAVSLSKNCLLRPSTQVVYDIEVRRIPGRLIRVILE